MDVDVDMTYRFLRDDEPTDEQLLVIMQEVGEEAKRKQTEIAEQVLENIKRESVRLHAARQNP